MQHLKSRIPLQRLGTPEEVASLVLHLAGDEGSFITGSELRLTEAARFSHSINIKSVYSSSSTQL